jgi:hypothetical protein
MAELTGEFDKDRTAAPSDEAIRRFLLSRLNSDEQTRLENNLFGAEGPNEDLEERVRAAELELADDYAFQRLSETERELFERKFLVTLDRKRKLEVSAALRNHLAALAAARATADPRSRESADTTSQIAPLREHTSAASAGILSWLGFKRPALGFALAFALLVIVCGVVWLALKNQRVIAKRDAVGTATPEARPSAQPSLTPETTVSPRPTPKITPTPNEPESTSLVATFLLLPNAVRDGGEMSRVRIPQSSVGGHHVVRLQLALEVDEPGSHSAELLTAEGRPIYVGRKLKTHSADSNSPIVFDVPARLLKPGDYQVKLNWIVGGSVTRGGRYYFRVTQ